MHSTSLMPAKRNDPKSGTSLVGSPMSSIFLFSSLGHRRKGLPLMRGLFEKLSDTNKHLVITRSPELKTTLFNLHYLGFFDQPRKF
jgi:hypothetical protein